MTSSSLAKKYQKKNLREHILDRPDSYVGSTSKDIYSLFHFEKNEDKIIKSDVKISPAFINLFDEALVNALDQSVREESVKWIKVNITDDTIQVINNGKSIEIEKHPEYGIYIPELIFGNLLTSSNYDDNDQKIVGGRNGLGIKCVSVYSKEFKIDIINNGKKYSQKFLNNMTDKTEPKITDSSLEDQVCITYKPDLKRFGMEIIDEDTVSILKKRVYDCSVISRKNVNVYFNKKKIDIKNFTDYFPYFSDNNCFIYDNIDNYWQVGISESDTFRHISFVNGISTDKGGTHVNFIINQIVSFITDEIKKKVKDSKIKPSYIKDHLFLMLKATVINPTFTSQTKEELSSPSSKFGFTPKLSDKFLKSLAKSDIIKKIINYAKFKEEQNNLKELSKTDASKKKTVRVPKLDDATKAGTIYSKECTLILTEGDSAKALAISGLSVLGRDRYGVFPLRGVLLNVREASQKQLINNEEIKNIKIILGLENNKKYKSLDELRYGKIMIMTDQDVDGIHIRGLILNLFHHWWPELLELGFATSLNTPIVKVKKGKEVLSFYNLQNFEKWKENNDHSKWSIKYYKGLGTSTKDEAREYFSSLDKNLLNYCYSPEDNECIKLAFDKKCSDDRKEWLTTYDRSNILDNDSTEQVSITNFVHKELIHFSMADVIRSIPNVLDGLKPSQRKVLFTCFKRNLKKEIKVSQLAASVSENTSYHHGEESLVKTIVNLAQNYTGSNNINYLQPIGQFGTRLENGKDHASARYIFTALSDYTCNLFDKFDNDQLTFLNDDGQDIEPEHYIPILPLILVNGAEGIGTGYSTSIPCFNPKDIIQNIRLLHDNKKLKPLVPWYKNFKGTITKQSNDKFICTGLYNTNKDNCISITELPIGISIEKFKQELEQLLDKKIIKSYINKSSDCDVNFIIKGYPFSTEENLIKDFKLSKNINLSNMYAFNSKGKITKYSTPNDIIKEFYEVRLKFYISRKKNLLKELNKEKVILENKIRFITEIINDTIKVFKIKKQEILNQLVNKKYFKLENTFDYLLKMNIYNFSEEDINSLNNKLEKVNAEVKILENSTEKDLWNTDLDNLICKI